MIKYWLCAVLFVGLVEATSGGESSCVATPLARREAERLVLSVPEALVAKKMGGKLSATEYKPPHSNDDFYYFTLLSTVSTPTTPLDNGMLGYFSVNKLTGRVVNVADEDAVGKELEKLQAKLRTKHCIGRALVLKNQAIQP
jgi:hypothetical protein